jgi:hypothetical protein
MLRNLVNKFCLFLLNLENEYLTWKNRRASVKLKRKMAHLSDEEKREVEEDMQRELAESIRKQRLSVPPERLEKFDKDAEERLKKFPY